MNGQIELQGLARNIVAGLPESTEPKEQDIKLRAIARQIVAGLPEKEPLIKEELPPEVSERMARVEAEAGKPRLQWMAEEAAKRTGKGLLDTMYGIGEAARTVATGIPAYILGVMGQTGMTLYDLWKSGFRDPDLVDALETLDPREIIPEALRQVGRREPTKEKIAEYLTYPAETRVGEAFAGIATAPFEAYFMGVDEIAKLTTDDPDVQKGIRYLADIALIYGVPKAKAYIKRTRQTNVPLSVEELKGYLKDWELPEPIKEKIGEIPEPTRPPVTPTPPGVPEVPVRGAEAVVNIKPQADGSIDVTMKTPREAAPHVREGGWSPEALARAKTTEFHMFDVRSKSTTPLIGPEAVDVSVGRGQVKVQVNKISGEATILDAGEGVAVTPALQSSIKAKFQVKEMKVPKERFPGEAEMIREAKEYQRRFEAGEDLTKLAEELRDSEVTTEILDKHAPDVSRRADTIKRREAAKLTEEEFLREEKKAEVLEAEELKLVEKEKVIKKVEPVFDVKRLPGIFDKLKIPDTHRGAITERVLKSYKPEEGKLDTYIKTLYHRYMTKEGEFRKPTKPTVELPKEEKIPARKAEEPEFIYERKEEAKKVESLLRRVSTDKRELDIARRFIINEESIVDIAKKTGKTRQAVWETFDKFRKKAEKDPEVRKVLMEKTGDSLRVVQEELRAELKEAKKEEVPRPALAIKPVRFGVEKPKFKFESAEIETRFEAAKGQRAPSVALKAKSAFVGLWHKMSRTYKDLPNIAEFAPAKTQLKMLEKQRSVAWQETVEILDGITIKADAYKHDLFRRRIILDDLAHEAKLGRELPFGFTKELLAKEKARLDLEVNRHPDVIDAIAKRKRVNDSMNKDYIYWQEKIGHPVEEKMKKPDYFRHQVLDYAQIKSLVTTGKKLKVPTRRGWLRKRKGSEYDINTDYLQAEAEVMSQKLYDIEVAKTLDFFDNEYSIYDRVKASAKKQKFENWEDAIPEGYEAFQPRQGNVFYLADTLPERIARQVFEGELKDMGVVGEKLGKALAIGKRRRSLVIKSELASTLNDLVQRPPDSVAGRINKKVLRAWKRWVLLSPRRVAKYNIRNATGDADPAFVGNIHGFTKTGQSISELYNTMILKKPMTQDMRVYIKRGGAELTLQAQEIGSLQTLENFKRFYDRKGGIEQIPIKAALRYWKTVRVATDFREQILRYANYLDYLEQIKKSPEGKPRNFGASLREEIMAEKTPEAKAFRLSNELLGAYDEISYFGQAIRQHIYPFWSFKELNFKRYFRLLKNAVHADNKASVKVARSILPIASMTGRTAIGFGRFAIKATGFWTALQVWNHVMFPDIEAELPEHVKSRAHVNLGRDKDGKALYFTRIGALGDFLEWFGLDAAPNLVSDYLSGKKSLKDIGKVMIRAPINQVAQGLHPGKGVFEILLKKSLFPDAFEARTIRDKGLHIARSLALDDEYKAIMGKPAAPYRETLPKAFVYKIDPLESAYYQALDIKNEFLEKVGRKGEGFRQTPRGDALYKMKMAHRYGDKKLEEKYLEEYISLHFLEQKETGKSTDEIWKSIHRGVTVSLNAMNPLYGLSKHDKTALINSLNPEEREVFAKAVRFYFEVLRGTTKTEED